MSTRFADHLLVGIADDRPVATAVPVGTLYSSTDEGVVYQSDGTDWANWGLIVPAAGVAVDGDILTLDTGLPVWAAGAGGAGTDTIYDAKGDLVVATAADTAARLPVGANGEI